MGVKGAGTKPKANTNTETKSKTSCDFSISTMKDTKGRYLVTVIGTDMDEFVVAEAGDPIPTNAEVPIEVKKHLNFKLEVRMCSNEAGGEANEEPSDDRGFYGTKSSTMMSPMPLAYQATLRVSPAYE